MDRLSDHFIDKCAELEQQRDQLLAAAKWAEQVMKDLHADGIEYDFSTITSAIAAVEQPAAQPETVAAWANRVGKVTAIKAADGWIEWKGGERPVGPYEWVAVKTRGGGCALREKAVCFRWNHADHPEDIVAYRVVQEGGA